MTDVSTLSLREALELVDPREAYFDLLVGKADWVALSGAVQAAEALVVTAQRSLALVESLPKAKQAAARRDRENAVKIAEAGLAEAQAAYVPHVRRVWFDPTPEYEVLRLKHRANGELAPVLLEKCARDSDVTADEWAAFIGKWPAGDRDRLIATVILLNSEPTVPDLGKGFSPSR